MNKKLLVASYMVMVPTLFFSRGTDTDVSICQALAQNSIKCFSKRTEILNKQVRSHITKNIRYGLAEVAMYNADKLLGLGMVPPTILVQYSAEGIDKVCCRSVWIEPDLRIQTESLRKRVTEEEWSAMNIFHFLFGQYDRHSGNLLISKETGRLYLIDNEAVANVHQVVLAYSPNKCLSCPWVGNVGDFVAARVVNQSELHTFNDVINAHQDPHLLHELFPAVDVWTKRDIDKGFCRVWHNHLWRQFYASEDLHPPFAERISRRLFEKIKSLTGHELSALWPVPPFQTELSWQQEYKDLIATFVHKTLERRDMIVRYFIEHPENIMAW